jgi:hypothetical protein
MATCRIIHSDLSSDGTFYETGSPATTWSPALTNLQDPLLSAVARTSQLLSATLGLRFTTAVTASGAAIAGSNLTKNATYRLTAYTGSPSLQVFTTGILPVSTTTKTIIDPDEKGFGFPILFGQDVTATDWVLELSDAANTDAFIELATFLLGTATTSEFGFWDGAEFSRNANTTILTALGGTRFYNKHKNIRRWTLSFPQEAYAKAWDEFDQMTEVNGLDRFVYVVAYPDDAERMHQHSFLGTFEQTSPLRQMATGRVGAGFDIVEQV